MHNHTTLSFPIYMYGLVVSIPLLCCFAFVSRNEIPDVISHVTLVTLSTTCKQAWLIDDIIEISFVEFSMNNKS